MNKIKTLAAVLTLLLLTVTSFAQKNLNMQFVIQPGNSFISGQWRNLAAYNAPPFKRGITPALDAGITTGFKFKGKAGKKVVYDDMYESGFYLADKIGISTGLFYSFCGENYKKMQQQEIAWQRNLRLQYLKVPLRVEFIKGKKEENQLIYTLGFYAAYLTWYKETNTVTSKDEQSSAVTKGTSTVVTYTATGIPPASAYYNLQSKPYNPFDYGALLGVGMQKKLNSDWQLQLMVMGQKGFADIKNKNAQYSNGSNSELYFPANVNNTISHTNSFIEVMVGMKKTFQYTPKPKEERKRWRIFRLKL
ncbi:MAG: hypothetical protein HY063_03390 [Bacteroidetes bacterium]|nr:hypothetical protein [Bacteroidota bacterium]